MVLLYSWIDFEKSVHKEPLQPFEMVPVVTKEQKFVLLNQGNYK